MTDDLHLARLEARYRQAVQEELGLEQGCAAILTLSLPAPELPQEIGLDERRLLDQAQRTGGLSPEQALHLEAFRFQRRKRQLLTAWSEPPRPPSSSSEEQTPWEEALDTPLCVLQGESGSGKSTLLRRVAVRQARRKQSLDGRRPFLPLYLPLAAATPLDSVELPIDGSRSPGTSGCSPTCCGSCRSRQWTRTGRMLCTATEKASTRSCCPWPPFPGPRPRLTLAADCGPSAGRR